MKAILGKKLNMGQMTTSDGRRVPVTRISAGPVTVTQLKTEEKDGYTAVQIGWGEARKTSKALQGHLKNSKVNPAVLKEIRLQKSEELNVGDEVKIGDVFRKGEVVDVTGISKGKGFAGGVKRHHFAGGPKTHGQSDRHRAPGSIGSGTTPGRVFKGMKMAGHLGAEKVTVQGLEVMEVSPEENILVVKGAIPGVSGAVLVITKSEKKRKVYHGPQVQALPKGDEEVPAEGEAKPEGEATASAEATADKPAAEAAAPAPEAAPAAPEGEANA